MYFDAYNVFETFYLSLTFHCRKRLYIYNYIEGFELYKSAMPTATALGRLVWYNIV